MPEYRLSHLEALEAESIHILRETAAEFERPALLYSAGKDSSVLAHLAKLAFAPGKIPFPFLHVDTGFKFPEMYEFRDRVARKLGVELKVFRNEPAIEAGTNPAALGTRRCCALLKTEALLQALREFGIDGAIGGARREEERSRAKERVFSFRTSSGTWEPRDQRPELWSLYNGRLSPGESMRIFPLSNWTELDVWRYIEWRAIEVVPLYFAETRKMKESGGQLLPSPEGDEISCRYRTLGCSPCTGAVRSTAKTISEIIAELSAVKVSERSTRAIDHDTDASMELKKREGYF
jgi:sulfate adenylyltransferase subunit 2